MVPAVGDEKQDVAPGGVKYRGDHGHVGQVGAAVIGVVEGDDVAWLQGASPQPQHGLHAFAHRAEMDRDMRGVGHQTALGVEYRAGKIQPLFDVDAERGVLQHGAHLLGDVHEQIVEQFEQHRVGLRAAGGDARRARFDPPQQQVIEIGHLGAPAGLDDRGRVGLADQRRSGDMVARPQDPCGRTPGRHARRRRST